MLTGAGTARAVVGSSRTTERDLPTVWALGTGAQVQPSSDDGRGRWIWLLRDLVIRSWIHGRGQDNGRPSQVSRIFQAYFRLWQARHRPVSCLSSGQYELGVALMSRSCKPVMTEHPPSLKTATSNA